MKLTDKEKRDYIYENYELTEKKVIRTESSSTNTTVRRGPLTIETNPWSTDNMETLRNAMVENLKTNEQFRNTVNDWRTTNNYTLPLTIKFRLKQDEDKLVPSSIEITIDGRYVSNDGTTHQFMQNKANSLAGDLLRQNIIEFPLINNYQVESAITIELPNTAIIK